jgi:hypothetical protein
MVGVAEANCNVFVLQSRMSDGKVAHWKPASAAASLVACGAETTRLPKGCLVNGCGYQFQPLFMYQCRDCRLFTAELTNE